MSLHGATRGFAPGDHASADDLALFVIDALAGPARQRLEGHVGCCASCASALAAEAAAERALQELWPVVRSHPRQPLAEVVALPRPAPTAPIVAPVKKRPVRAAYQSSLGGLAAAVVTVLFLGWWTDAGRLFTQHPIDQGRLADRLAGRMGASLTACLMSGDRSASDDARGRICAPAPPSLGGMASWGMCALGAPAGGGVCPSLPDPVCSLLPEAQ